MTDYAEARRTMVDRQIMTADVTDRAILRAIGEVPREMFAPPALQPLAYSDADLPLTKTKPGETPRYLVEPAILARLTQLAEIGPDDIVLDVGCGTGYSAAFLSLLANSVVALESDPELSAIATETLLELDIVNVAVVTGPLEAGYPSEGPYDVVLMAGSVEEVPEALLRQLKEGGRLVTIVGVGPAGMATIFTHSDGDFSRRSAFNAPAPPLPGFAKAKTFQF
jgi:protein-L-isoaspartate(D-aspartate) O-methyltransferase